MVRMFKKEHRNKHAIQKYTEMKDRLDIHNRYEELLKEKQELKDEIARLETTMGMVRECKYKRRKRFVYTVGRCTGRLIGTTASISAGRMKTVDYCALVVNTHDFSIPSPLQ